MDVRQYLLLRFKLRPYPLLGLERFRRQQVAEVRGVEHLPEALTEECHVMLLEPSTTLNTGNVENERTRRELDRIA